MTIKELINGVDQLVSLPDAVIRANELIDSPDSNASEIGEVIGHDPSLSAKLLKLVNSAFYSYPAQVDTISRAITLIGTNELRSLVVASSATSAFSSIDPELVDMNAFWHRSVFCGLVAKKIAAASQRGKGESQFLCGLLHDVGKLLMFLRIPDQANDILQLSAQSGQPIHAVEQQQLGFTSAELGAALLNAWRLPERLWEPVKFQHHPEASSNFVEEAHILSLALAITNQLEPELKAGSAPTNLENLDTQALVAFGLNAETISLIALDANMESFEVLSIINPSATTIF